MYKILNHPQRIALRASRILEDLMGRLQPLWQVARRPARSILQGPVGTILGLAIALLSVAWVSASRGTFTPWQPNQPQLAALLDAARRVYADKALYPATLGPESFTNSPVGAWAGTVFAAGARPVPMLPAVGWLLLQLVLMWALCWLLGLRDWRAGFAVAFVANIEPVRGNLAQGAPELTLMLLICIDLLAPRRRWAWLRGIPTGIAIAIDPLLAPLLLIVWITQRHRAALVALGTGLGLTLLAALFSPAATAAYLTRVLPQKLIRPRDPGFVDNQSPLGAWYRWLGNQGIDAAQLGLWLLALAGIVAGCVLARRRQPLLGLNVTALALLCAQPVTLVAAYVWAIPAVIALWRAPIRTPIRLLGLLATGWLIVHPWQSIGSWRGGSPDPLTGFDLGIANLGPILLVIWLLATLSDLRADGPRTPLPQPVRRSLWTLLLLGLPALTSLWIAGTFVASRPWPWQALMPDFQVYVTAGKVLLAGGDIYAGDGWPFLYPPFAALFTIPLGLGYAQAGAMLLQIANGVAFALVFYKAGLKVWQVPFVTSATFLIFQVLGADVVFGNIQGLIIAMVLLDVLPGPSLTRLLPGRLGHRPHLLPHGILLGLATAIKLLPGLFIIHLLLTRRYKTAFTALGSFAGFTLVGCLLLPRQAARFAGVLLNGEMTRDIEGGLLHYQSVVSGLQRLIGYSDGAQTLATLISLLLGGICFLAGIRWHRAGHAWFGAALCGIATIHLSPVAWGHYYVWLIPAAVAVLSPRPEATAGVDPTEKLPAIGEFLICSTLFLTGWATFQFHLALPSENEIEATYSTTAKLVAAMLPFGTAALGILALLWQRVPPRADVTSSAIGSP
ncbi:glycosyltransferase family 87 protein [Enemella evansiae]|uniref:glycosyltransferase family 87 protein n=1 Tax=Enemella evansiae TaxID=2016499 RepID=UPI0015C67DA6|nr:glycosyltransferase family 87 protein [Enemella evansiae]